MNRPEELAQACLPRLTREETALIAAAIRKAVGEALDKARDEIEHLPAGLCNQTIQQATMAIRAIRDRWLGEGE